MKIIQTITVASLAYSLQATSYVHTAPRMLNAWQFDLEDGKSDPASCYSQGGVTEKEAECNVATAFFICNPEWTQEKCDASIPPATCHCSEIFVLPDPEPMSIQDTFWENGSVSFDLDSDAASCIAQLDVPIENADCAMALALVRCVLEDMSQCPPPPPPMCDCYLILITPHWTKDNIQPVPMFTLQDQLDLDGQVSFALDDGSSDCMAYGGIDEATALCEMQMSLYMCNSDQDCGDPPPPTCVCHLIPPPLAINELHRFEFDNNGEVTFTLPSSSVGTPPAKECLLYLGLTFGEALCMIEDVTPGCLSSMTYAECQALRAYQCDCAKPMLIIDPVPIFTLQEQLDQDGQVFFELDDGSRDCMAYGGLDEATTLCEMQMVAFMCSSEDNCGDPPPPSCHCSLNIIDPIPIMTLQEQLDTDGQVSFQLDDGTRDCVAYAGFDDTALCVMHEAMHMCSSEETCGDLPPPICACDKILVPILVPIPELEDKKPKLCKKLLDKDPCKLVRNCHIKPREKIVDACEATCSQIIDPQTYMEKYDEQCGYAFNASISSIDGVNFSLELCNAKTLSKNGKKWQTQAMRSDGYSKEVAPSGPRITNQPTKKCKKF